MGWGGMRWGLSTTEWDGVGWGGMGALVLLNGMWWDGGGMGVGWGGMGWDGGLSTTEWDVVGWGWDGVGPQCY